MNTLVFSTIQ